MVSNIILRYSFRGLWGWNLYDRYNWQQSCICIMHSHVHFHAFWLVVTNLSVTLMYVTFFSIFFNSVTFAFITENSISKSEQVIGQILTKNSRNSLTLSDQGFKEGMILFYFRSSIATIYFDTKLIRPPTLYHPP